MITIADLEERGFNLLAYGNAWKDGNETAMMIHHPANFMTEAEVENIDNLRNINNIVAYLFNIEASK